MPRTVPSSESLPDKQAVVDFFFLRPPSAPTMPRGHGKVESGTFLFYLTGGEMDDDLRRRDVVTAVFQAGGDAVTALPDGGVGRPPEAVLVGLDAEAVDLDLNLDPNDVSVDAVDDGAKSLIEHGGTTSEDLKIPASAKNARNGPPGFNPTRLVRAHLSPEVPGSDSRGLGSGRLEWTSSGGCGKPGSEQASLSGVGAAIDFKVLTQPLESGAFAKPFMRTFLQTPPASLQNYETESWYAYAKRDSGLHFPFWEHSRVVPPAYQVVQQVRLVAESYGSLGWR
jgi:hypothetical protein